jgi:hypothetical protein
MILSIFVWVGSIVFCNLDATQASIRTPKNGVNYRRKFCGILELYLNGGDSKKFQWFGCWRHSQDWQNRVRGWRCSGSKGSRRNSIPRYPFHESLMTVVCGDTFLENQIYNLEFLISAASLCLVMPPSRPSWSHTV